MHTSFSNSDVLGKYCGDEANVGPATVHELAEHRAAMAVHELMSATKALSEMAASRTSETFVRREATDIELAYTRLGRMLSHIRGRHA